MTADNAEPANRPRARTALVAAVVVVLLGAALAVWATSRSGDVAPDAAASPGGTVAAPTPSATPSSSPTSTSTTTPPPDASAPAADPAEPSAPSADAQDPSPLPAQSGDFGAFGDPVAAPVGERVDVASGVAVAVEGLEAVDGEARGPGEVSGPAVRFSVRVANTTGADVDLTSAAVNAYFGPSATPGLQLSGSGASPLPASVAAGGTVTGVYVFRIPEDRTPTRVEVFSVAGADVVIAEAPTP